MKTKTEIIKGITDILHDRWPEAKWLLDKMITKAGDQKPYKAQFDDWVLNGSTLLLRELVSCFGEYNVSGSEMMFRNSVNAIDTAHYIVDTTISSIFVGYYDNKVIDMKTGRVYLLEVVSPVTTKATLTDETWGDPTSRIIMLNKIRYDKDLKDENLLPLSSGEAVNASICYFNGQLGKWEH